MPAPQQLMKKISQMSDLLTNWVLDNVYSGMYPWLEFGRRNLSGKGCAQFLYPESETAMARSAMMDFGKLVLCSWKHHIAVDAVQFD
jgi:hypothetical protein